MTDFSSLTLLSVIATLGAGLVGGLAYDYYNKLVSVKTWLQALGHAGAGAIAALLVVLSGGLGTPTDQTSFLLLAAIGYGGTDVIDSFVQKLQTAAAALASKTGTTPPPTS